jgi:predicted acetyltransferase
VRDFVSLRPEGYHALLSFFASHHLWQRLVLEGGRDVPWALLVANPQDLQTHGEPGAGFLLRVVDLERIITQHTPTDRAVPDVTVRVHDAAAPWNDGVWSIGRRAEGWHCERLADRAADAAVDIGIFAALFSGALAVRPAVDLGLLIAKGSALPTLEALFEGQYSPHSGDHF